MAEINSLKGWRYNSDIFENIDNLTSPLFDINTKKDYLYSNAYNSINISSPKQGYLKAKDVLDKWKSENIIVEDEKPSIYVYYQYFELSDDEKVHCRKGFICNVRIYDWSENIVLRHEHTIPDAVQDRLKLLENIKINTSPTHGIYSDPDLVLEKYMDESIKTPVYDSIDYQGVRDIMAIIDNPQIIKHFIDCLKEKKIIIADGHHRYESSLLYKKSMEKYDPDYNSDKLYNYHLMYLTNSEKNDIKIFPTHRILKDFDNLNKEDFLNKLSMYFNILKLKDSCDINFEIVKSKYSFAIMLKDSIYSINLKPEFINKIEWDLPEVVKQLDITVLHYFILYKVLGISQQEQRTNENIDFRTDFSECYTGLINGNYQLVIITEAVSMNEVQDVCYSGNVMPQKSTFFYPKVICGFVFSDI